MPRERTFMLLLLTVVLVGLAIGHMSRDTFRLTPSDSPTVLPLTPQEAAERRWQEATFSREAVFGGDGLMQRPQDFRVGGDGHVYVLDSAQRLIRKFSPQGDLVGTLPDPEARAQGQADLYGPTGLALTPAGEVWVCDADDVAVKVFDAAGQLRQTYRLEASALRVLAVEDGGFVVNGRDSSLGTFARYDAGGNLVRAFGRLVEDPFQDALVLDGWIAGSAGTFVFAALHVGYLASYTTAGNLRFFVETIDRTPLPNLIVDVTDRDVRWIDPEAPRVAYSVLTEGDRIHVLTRTRSGKGAGGVLDTYRHEDGAYMHSIEMPEEAIRAHRMGPFLYTLREDRVVRWQLAPSPDDMKVTSR